MENGELNKLEVEKNSEFPRVLEKFSETENIQQLHCTNVQWMKAETGGKGKTGTSLIMPKVVVKTKIQLFAIIALIVSACNNRPFYEKYIAIENRVWHADSIISFSINVKDTSSIYTIRLNLRNNSDYPYSNIFLFREITSSRGIEFKDTVEYFLADRYGKWTGRGIGELKTSSWPYKSGELRFNRSGIYKFSIQQAMRIDQLKGIEDIGITIYRINQ